MDWYSLSRQWFDFAFENYKANCNHTALFFYIVEKWNRYWNKKVFWLPTIDTMQSIWIKNRNTYYKTFDDLVEWWFIELVQNSKNQYASREISICNRTKTKGLSSLDKSLMLENSLYNSDTTTDTGTDTTTDTGTVHIDKQRNKETKKQVNTMREDFETYKLQNPETVTTKVLTRFFEIWYIPAEKETIETFKEWLINASKESWKTAEMIEKESFKWMTHYEQNKPKNHKSSFLNWITREFVWTKSK